MFPFRKEMNELKQEMIKLQEYILTFKEKIKQIYTSNYNSDFVELLELYTAVENCYESFNTRHATNTKFGIPDELVKPGILSTDSIIWLHESIEYLEMLQDFLSDFKDVIQNLPEVMPVNSKPKIQIIQPRKSKSSHLPIGILRDEKSLGTALQDKSVPPIAIINSSESPAMAKRKRSIDKTLLGDEYVPFNVAIPDERDNERSILLNQPSSILPSINISEYGMPQIETLENKIPTEIELNTANKNSTEPISNSKAYESDSKVLERCISPHNIPPEGASSLINLQSIDEESSIQKQSNITQQQSVVEVPAADITNIDQNALEIMKELSKQRSHRIKKITRLSDSISSNNTEHTQTTTVVPNLKRTKVRKIRDQLVLLPQDINEYQLKPHFFHFEFNVHTQAVIDEIVRLRSTLTSPVQRNLIEEVEVHLPAITQFESEVQRLRSNFPHFEKSTDIPHIEIQPDRQSSLQLTTLENIEQLSIIVPAHSSQISPMPVIGSIAESRINKEKLKDASYTHFKNVLKEQPLNSKATPKKPELSLSTDRKSLRQMSEGDMIKHMELDHYVTLCLLREIQRKYSDSNPIVIHTIQAHFGNDRIGYCKLIRTAIDLQCYDVIRILKEGNELSGILIYI